MKKMTQSVAYLNSMKINNTEKRFKAGKWKVVFISDVEPNKT